MGLILFGRTQLAKGTPFDNTNPEAIAAGLSSNNVEDAIIEAKQDAINNDRYPFQASYGGNAGSGRYLEIFAGLASYPDAPFVFPENSAIKTITLGCTAVATVTIGFFKLTDLVNPVFSVSLTAETRKIFYVNHIFAANEEMAIRVTSGSINRPFMRVWINTVT